MTTAQNLLSRSVRDDAQILEKIITTNDLADLSPLEKVKHIKNICETLGLNPLTKPIQLLKFQGKEVLYCTKDATEQLRKNHKISIDKLESKMMDGVYIATAFASTPSGRTDVSTGAVTIAGAKGDTLCNALLKAETKAKRRVTLSICGLGFLDETEIETMPNAKKLELEIITTQDIDLMPECYVFEKNILKCTTEEELKKIFDEFRKSEIAKKPELAKRVIDAKDRKKNEFSTQEFVKEMYDEKTGEVINE